MCPGGEMVPEITLGPDGLLSRRQAAQLCGVTPEAINNWVRDGYGPKGKKTKLPVRRRDSTGHPRFDPIDVAKAERATAKRARRLTAPPLRASREAA
jgi:hypothetical protein